MFLWRRLLAKLDEEVRYLWYYCQLSYLIFIFVIDNFPASFEVIVNGQVIHSKLSTNAFPDFEEVAEIVKSVEEGSNPRQVTKTSSAGCNIM